MTTVILPAAPRCSTCNGPTVVTEGDVTQLAHLTWCRWASRPGTDHSIRPKEKRP